MYSLIAKVRLFLHIITIVLLFIDNLKRNIVPLRYKQYKEYEQPTTDTDSVQTERCTSGTVRNPVQRVARWRDAGGQSDKLQ
jgi:hypothetical protein